MIRRREFTAGLAGAAVVGPRGALGQQIGQVPRVGVLVSQPANDAEGQSRIAAFRQGLQELGWVTGRNLQMDIRWGGGSLDKIREDAKELVSLAPNVILASGGQVVAPLLK